MFWPKFRNRHTEIRTQRATSLIAAFHEDLETVRKGGNRHGGIRLQLGSRSICGYLSSCKHSHQKRAVYGLQGKAITHYLSEPLATPQLRGRASRRRARRGGGTAALPVCRLVVGTRDTRWGRGSGAGEARSAREKVRISNG